MYYLPDPESQVLRVIKWNTFYQMDNVLGALLTKISIGIFILRIKNTKRLRIFVWVSMVLMTCATLAVIIVLLVACTPMRKLWTPDIAGTCIPAGSVYSVSYVQSGFAVVVDIGLTLSPIFVLWNVKIDRRRKIAICILMSLGIIATISNILRNVYVPTLTGEDETCMLLYQILCSSKLTVSR